MGGEFTFNIGGLATWAGAFASLVAVLISATSLMRGARKAELDLLHKRISVVKDRQDGHGERLTRVEAELEHLPTKEMVLQLGISLARMEGQMGEMNAKFDGVSLRVGGIGNAVEQLVENELRGPRT